jgi:TrmH family RNA methyltransferase
MLSDNFRAVLVAPEFPGNIGSAARALKTMGLKRLCLVNPACDPFDAAARAMAHNAGDILDAAVVLPDLPSALAGTVFSLAATGRPRRQGAPFLTPPEAAARIVETSDAGDVALVFGRESSGLTNDELALCSMLTSIPAAVDVPSLNLAQAVMVYAYEIHQRVNASSGSGRYPWSLVPHEELERFFERLESHLSSSGVSPATTMANYVARFRRILARVPLESRDLRLLHNLIFKDRGLSTEEPPDRADTDG